MAESIIPKRPSNDGEYSAIKANDRDCLSYAVAFNVPNERAFALFHPEFLDESGRLTKLGKSQSKQFFSYAKHRSYMDEYRATLQKSLGKCDRVELSDDGIDDTRKDKVLKQLLSQAMSLVESGDGLDPDTMKTVVEVFRKLNILKDDVVEQEAPRRYLPCRCGECSYRSFVESYVGTGEIENDCLRCKALDIAKEHGFRYDPKTLLREADEKSAK